MNHPSKLLIALPLFLALFLGVPASFTQSWAPLSAFLPTALAEDDDEREEDEDEDEREDDDNKTTSKTSTSTETKKIIQETIEYKPVTKTIVVTDEDYQKDTDGDKLVDAIDPDPRISQIEYFTDTDGDSVPNALDKHHDEDDFAYYDAETDDNGNGILDSYEGTDEVSE